jgi:hypothetical protein
MILIGKNRRNGKETHPIATLSIINYHKLAWDRSWISAVKGRQLPS